MGHRLWQQLPQSRRSGSGAAWCGIACWCCRGRGGATSIRAAGPLQNLPAASTPAPRKLGNSPCAAPLPPAAAAAAPSASLPPHAPPAAPLPPRGQPPACPQRRTPAGGSATRTPRSAAATRRRWGASQPGRPRLHGHFGLQMFKWVCTCHGCARVMAHLLNEWVTYGCVAWVSAWHGPFLVVWGRVDRAW